MDLNVIKIDGASKRTGFMICTFVNSSRSTEETIIGKLIKFKKLHEYTSNKPLRSLGWIQQVFSALTKIEYMPIF